jgi:sirohydrochlorin cobaltochelatase
MSSSRSEDLAVVLIGHGAPATDCPPELVGRLMSLEWRAGGGHAHGGSHAHGGDASQQAAALDAQIRQWPRRPDNDPYKAGLERMAERLRPLLPTRRFAIGYNEFCSPSIGEAIAQVAGQGVRRVLVLSTMLTPGGVHSEKDIPRALAEARRAHPGVTIEYLWPFDLDRVAELLASHVANAVPDPARE